MASSERDGSTAEGWSVSRRRVEAVVLALVVVTAGAGVALVTETATVSTELAANAPSLGPLDGPNGDRPPRPETVPAAVATLHEAGVTGEGVTVGVVDATGFDVDHPALRSHVGATRSFGAGGIERGASARHGTATALAALAVAPGADLVLANARSPAGAARAVRWAGRRDVDVLVVPVNELGAADTGRGTLASAVRAVADRGTLVVVPTGNHARSHWEGRLHPTRRGLQTFGSTTRLWLAPPVGSPRQPGGAVRLWLSWNGTAFPRDLTLELYRVGPDGSRRVATSERVRSGAVNTERLATLVRPGDLFVALRFENRTVRRFDPLPVGVELTATNHRFADPVSAGSIAAPATATAPAAVSVGAYDARRDGVAPYSGRGPTADGRRGVDLVAPTGVWPGEVAGTSAAAAYTAGVAALVAGAAPAEPPDRWAAAIRREAVDIGRDGPDPVAGHGRLAPVAAVAAASDRSNLTADAPADWNHPDEPTTQAHRS